MYKNPSTKNKPAMHNLGKNVHKILGTKCDLMQKTTSILEQYLICYDFMKWEKKKHVVYMNMWKKNWNEALENRPAKVRTEPQFEWELARLHGSLHGPIGNEP